MPSKGEAEEFEVFDFEGAGGVALSMYNTDEVILIAFASMFSFLSSLFLIHAKFAVHS